MPSSANGLARFNGNQRMPDRTWAVKSARPRQLQTDRVNSHRHIERTKAQPTIDLDQLNRCLLFERSVINWSIFLCDLDPFSIYKGNYKCNTATKDKIYLIPKLRLKPTKSDKLKDILRRPAQITFCYLAIKFLTICVIQTTSCFLAKRHKIYHDLLMQSPNQSDATMVASMEYYSSSIRQVDQLGDLIGNPMSALPAAAILFQSILLIAIAWGFLMTPHSFRQTPMDVANLRFLLDPHRELQRIDLVIERHIERILVESPTNRLVMAQFKQTSSLRPSTLNGQWHNLSYWCIFLFTTGAILASLLHEFVSYPLMFTIVYRKRCKFNYYCSLWSLFTWRELLMLLELFIAQFPAIVFWSAGVITTTFILVCQVWLALGIKRELDKCLAILRNENNDFRKFYHKSRMAHELRLTNNKLNPLHRVLRLNGSMPLVDATNDPMSPFNELGGRGDAVTQVILRTYIRMVVSIGEFRRAADCARRFLEIVMVLHSALVVVVNLINYVSEFDAGAIEIMALVLTYLVTNLMLFLSAYTFSLISKQERTAWSILAELSTYRDNHRDSAHMLSDRILLDTITTKWLRYIYNHNLSDRKNTLLPYGLSISYRTVLTLNFSLLSLASLSRSSA